MQEILIADKEYRALDGYFARCNAKNVLLVCDPSIKFLRLDGYFSALKERTGINVVRFSDFQPNPLYESVVEGVKLFALSGCDLIAAIGGGSAMDVAKCIKLYYGLSDAELYFKQQPISNSIPLLAIPTTAGTGSEATRYAVIYYNGEKQSVTDISCIPSAVLFDASALKTLPAYQKKSTVMDALCHSIESFWSINSTDESKEYSKKAIRMILEDLEGYISNDESCNANMLMAANIAGRAINITQTTGGHAMSYKLTSLYGIAHGHAAAVCDAKLFPYMINNTDKCIDPRGAGYLVSVFEDIAKAMGCKTPYEAAVKFESIVSALGLSAPEVKDAGDIAILKRSVNITRLKNHPIRLSEDAIEALYREILNV